jgi:hypothetical protein
MATAVIVGGIALEEKYLPAEITLIRELFALLGKHKKPAAAIQAAKKAVIATPDDADTNDPSSPYYVP